MEALYTRHLVKLSNIKTTFRRDLIDNINWDDRMIALKGARGVGKTTMMLQHIKETFGSNKAALYVSMDSINTVGTTIWDMAQYHLSHGGTHMFVDEIHKYDNWSMELKNIYDDLPNLKLMFSSSSILQIYKGYADLSRRVVSYQLNGLSFREYLQIETKQPLTKLSLSDILNNHAELALDITQKIKPLAYFKEYLKRGYYPFYLEGKNSYYQKISNVIGLILEVDLPYILDVNISNVIKIKKLLKYIGNAVPFQLNISKLSSGLEMTRGTTTQYIHYLEQAELLNLLTSHEKAYSQLTKPEKIYLQNPNLSYALSDDTVNIGTIRELFFMNQVKAVSEINHTKIGDFLVNERYIFEIGGSGKTFSQISNTANSYLAVDDLELGYGNKIPLWLFGFLY